MSHLVDFAILQQQQTEVDEYVKGINEALKELNDRAEAVKTSLDL